MSMTAISHVVPALPPQIDGVGDYALNLARQLRENHGIQSRFVVCDPDWDGPSRVDNFTVRRLRIKNEAGIWSLLQSGRDHHSTVLLHYAGLSYHKHGVPHWLYRGVKSWLAEAANRGAQHQKQLITVFHELWASPTKPWKKQFYAGILQRRLIEQLHRQSNLSIAGTRQMQIALENIIPKKTLWLPMPSNVPVIPSQPSESRRNTKLKVAIFGLHSSRCEAIRVHSNLLRTLDRKSLLSGAMLIGKGSGRNGLAGDDMDLLQRSVSRQRIEVLGELSGEDVAKTLGTADVFLSPHPAEFACKSGACMAAMAMGCAPVLRDGKNAAPLNESEHFIASDDSQDSVARFEQSAAAGQLNRISTMGRLWYEQHANWRLVANRYRLALSLILPSPKDSPNN